MSGWQANQAFLMVFVQIGLVGFLVWQTMEGFKQLRKMKATGIRMDKGLEHLKSAIKSVAERQPIADAVEAYFRPDAAARPIAVQQTDALSQAAVTLRPIGVPKPQLPPELKFGEPRPLNEEAQRIHKAALALGPGFAARKAMAMQALMAAEREMSESKRRMIADMERVMPELAPLHYRISDDCKNYQPVLPEGPAQPAWAKDLEQQLTKGSEP